MPDTEPHPNRRISPGWVTAVVALVVQIIVVGIWGGGMGQRVSALEARTAPLEAGALVRVEERVASVQASVERIERRLEAGQ